MTSGGGAEYWGPQYGPGYPPTPTPPTDDQLRALPPPAPVPPTWVPTGQAAQPTDQRPAVVGLAVSMAVTASVLWVCGLSFGWLVAIAAGTALAQDGSDGVVFHLLDEFRLRLLDGLVVPLYGFPLASCVTGFLLLVRRPWTRLAHTAVGVLALGWSAWWLRDSLLMWGTVALYVGVALAVLWTPGASRWYARGAKVRPRGHLLEG